MRAPLLVADWAHTLLGHFISVDEGHFDQNGEFVVECRRNGDQIRMWFVARTQCWRGASDNVRLIL